MNVSYQTADTECRESVTVVMKYSWRHLTLKKILEGDISPANYELWVSFNDVVMLPFREMLELFYLMLELFYFAYIDVVMLICWKCWNHFTLLVEPELSYPEVVGFCGWRRASHPSSWHWSPFRERPKFANSPPWGNR